MNTLINSRNVTRFCSIVIGALLCLSAGTRAIATDLFSVKAVTADAGPPMNITVGSSSLLDLVKNAEGAQAQFAGFAGRTYNVTLQYAGVNNAMNFAINSAGTTATLN